MTRNPPDQGEATSNANFVFARYRPVYAYAALGEEIGTAVFVISVMGAMGVAVFSALLSLPQITAGPGAVSWYFMKGCLLALLVFANGWAFRFLSRSAASLLRCAADAALGVAPLTREEKMQILVWTGSSYALRRAKVPTR